MEKNSLKYVYQCTFVAAVGGLLFGYDTAVVAGAIGFIQEKYELSAAMTGWVASCALIGCMVGAMFAGSLSDRMGRKKVLMISAVAFAVSSLGIMLPWGLDSFIFFRFIGGVGIGIASMLAPMYISEIAPADIRGRLISIYQLGIVIGILLIYFVNAGIAGLHDEAWNVEIGWRWMFGSGIIPSIVFIVLLFIVPESPRWLAKQDRWAEAEHVLVKVNGATKAKDELVEIRQALGMKQGALSDLFKPGLRTALIIGVMLAILSQVTGINVIMYYAPEIFKATGDATSSALLQTILVGGINVLMTIVAIKYVDKLGRKKLLLIGSAGMALCLGWVGLAFYAGMAAGYWVLIGILLYISFFAISLGPLTFVVVAEIFPNNIRGRAMSVAIFFLWLSVYVVSQTFPMLLESIGSAWTFWIYMVMAVVAFLFVWRAVPETKEKTLEEIEKMWTPKQRVTRPLLSILFICAVAGFSCGPVNKIARADEYADSRIVTKSVSQWEEMLRRTSGWIGADGVYAVALNGIETPGKAHESQTLFWFSDNIWGTVNGDTLADGWEFTNNCVAILDGGEPSGDKIEFFSRKDADGKHISIFEPKTPNAQEGDYYWLGDGFFNHSLDSSIHIFAYRIRNVPGTIFPFEDVGLSLITIPKGSRPPFEKQTQKDVPFFLKDSKGRGKVVFGAAVLANTEGAGTPAPDGFIYIYGIRGAQKELIVARVEDRFFEDFERWRFWNGNEWVPDVHDCVALTERVSNEMSVSFMEDGRVIAAYQLDTNSPEIVIQAGKTPFGPFQPRKTVWSTPEIYDDLDFYTYNGKAHPHLSQPGEILISYNVNSFDFEKDMKNHPWHLRPRFITVKY